MDSLVNYEAVEGIAKVVLNRPEKLNSLNRLMAEQLRSCLDQAGADESVRAVWLGGAGSAFCAGQDLKELTAEDGGAAADSVLRERFNPLIRVIRGMEKPVVCAVQGAAAGAGANLALACDLIMAGEDAYFLEPFCGLGLIPDSGGTYLLPRLAGLQRAAAMCFLGEKVPAEQALAWGLIYRVVPSDALRNESLAVARKLVFMPATGLRLTKRALDQSLENGLEAQLELEAELQGHAGRTSEFREAVNAFLAKRKLASDRRGDG